MTITDLVGPPADSSFISTTRSTSMTLRQHRRPAARYLASASTPRLAVVEPNALVRAALPLMLTGFVVSGSFATTDALIASRPQADIVLVVVGGEGRRDEGSVRALSRAGYRVCLYTSERRRAVIARLIGAGARGVVSQSDPVASLAHALSRISEGGTAISNEYASAATSTPLVPELTSRQLQVLGGRARGETFHSIAKRLQISERTAQDHWSAISRRFEVFLRSHSPADLERSLGLDNGVASLTDEELR